MCNHILQPHCLVLQQTSARAWPDKQQNCNATLAVSRGQAHHEGTAQRKTSDCEQVPQHSAFSTVCQRSTEQPVMWQTSFGRRHETCTNCTANAATQTEGGLSSNRHHAHRCISARSNSDQVKHLLICNKMHIACMLHTYSDAPYDLLRV